MAPVFLPESLKQPLFPRQRVLFPVWKYIQNPWEPQQEQQAA